MALGLSKGALGIRACAVSGWSDDKYSNRPELTIDSRVVSHSCLSAGNEYKANQPDF